MASSSKSSKGKVKTSGKKAGTSKTKKEKKAVAVKKQPVTNKDVVKKSKQVKKNLKVNEQVVAKSKKKGKPIVKTVASDVEMGEPVRTPVGVKLLSIIGYIVAVLSLIFGVLLILSVSLLKVYFSQTLFAGFFGSTFLIVFGIVYFVFGLFFIFVSRGLWKGQNWARIVTIVTCILGVVWVIYDVILGDYVNLISLAVGAFIASYLLFNRNVRDAFVISGGVTPAKDELPNL